MPDAAKKPCRICRRWFRPDVRVGDRQHTCSRPECQAARCKKTQAAWRSRNPEYFVAYRIQERNASKRMPEPLPLPLSQLPWDIAQDEFGPKGADFIAVMGKVLLRAAKDQFDRQVVEPSKDPALLAPGLAKDQFQAELVEYT